MSFADCQEDPHASHTLTLDPAHGPRSPTTTRRPVYRHVFGVWKVYLLLPFLCLIIRNSSEYRTPHARESTCTCSFMRAISTFEHLSRLHSIIDDTIRLGTYPCAFASTFISQLWLTPAPDLQKGENSGEHTSLTRNMATNWVDLKYHINHENSSARWP